MNAVMTGIDFNNISQLYVGGSNINRPQLSIFY